MGRVLLLAVLALCTLVPATVATAAPLPASNTLPPDVLAANQEIDRKFLEAHRVIDVDMIMGLFTTSPDVFVIGPTGILYKGRDQVRQSVENLFVKLVSMTGVIDHVTYLPAGDGGVIAYGQVTYHRQLKGQPPDTRVVVWSDYRRRENGRWVIVFRHVHWPLAANGWPDPTTTTKAPTAAR